MSYDLLVIGGGSGGVRAARLAAQKGKKVALFEGSRLGGTCVIRGCVPKKLLSYAAQKRYELEDAAGYGWAIEMKGFSWETLRTNQEKEVARLEGIYGKLLNDSGVEVIKGWASFQGENTILCEGQTYQGDRILIATGGTPHIPGIEGADLALTSDHVFSLEKLPKKIAIWGGGYIAAEFASIFCGLGVETHLLFRRQRILAGFDIEIREKVQAAMAEKGVILHPHTELSALEKRGQNIVVKEGDKEIVETDVFLAATGRKPMTDSLGLENLETSLLSSRGAIEVDDYSQTSLPSVFAVGDVTGRVSLTPVAIAEAMAFIETVFENQPTKLDYDLIPTAVFSLPNAAAVGLTQETALEEGYDIHVYHSEFTPMYNSLPQRKEKILMKLVVDQKTERVLGAHMIGAESADIIQILAISLKMGAKKKDLDSTIALHPCVAEDFVTMRNFTSFKSER